MIGMGVGNQRPRNRTPWVDPGLRRLAIQPFSCAFDQARLWNAADSLKAPQFERVCLRRDEAPCCCSVRFSPGRAQLRFGSEKDSEGTRPQPMPARLREHSWHHLCLAGLLRDEAHQR